MRVSHIFNAHLTLFNRFFYIHFMCFFAVIKAISLIFLKRFCQTLNYAFNALFVLCRANYHLHCKRKKAKCGFYYIFNVYFDTFLICFLRLFHVFFFLVIKNGFFKVFKMSQMLNHSFNALLVLCRQITIYSVENKR